jgi:histidinol-phosphatase (PHP family)
LYDYHLHTAFSADSDADPDDIINAAIHKGLEEIALTDHYDPMYRDPDFPFELDFTGYTEMLGRVTAQYKDEITIKKGIELGMQPGAPNRICAETAAAFPFDFIIGSVHCARGVSLDTPDYLAPRTPEQAVTDYYDDMLAAITDFTDFDVLGHINYVERYIERIPDETVYMNRIEQILKKLIELGKGIEINTSSYRYGLKDTTPTMPILKLYKKLGGEIVTTGSDAHKAADVGDHLEAAGHMLREAGIDYIATYKNRKPTLHKLK